MLIEKIFCLLRIIHNRSEAFRRVQIARYLSSYGTNKCSLYFERIFYIQKVSGVVSHYIDTYFLLTGSAHWQIDYFRIAFPYVSKRVLVSFLWKCVKRALLLSCTSDTFPYERFCTKNLSETEVKAGERQLGNGLLPNSKI